MENNNMKRYINGNITIFKENKVLISEEEMDDFINKLIELIEDHKMGMFANFGLVDSDELDSGEK